MHTPLADWDALDSKNFDIPKEIVWGAQLDNRYQIEIQRIDNATASYGAMFGSDVDDVCQWMDMAADFVDSLNSKN